MNPTNERELREQLIELDGELWDYQLDKLTAYITANYTPDKRTGELALMASAYRDNGRNEFTQVTANCPCGRGGWIRLPKHPDIEVLEAERNKLKEVK